MNNPQLHYQQKTERLADAFRVFNQLSENLALSYQGLQEQVAYLNQQLEAARNERLATLGEKEKLANRLQQILAALPAAVIVLNAQGRVLDCNQHAIDFLGEPLLGVSWQAVLQRSLSPVADSPHERRLNDGRIVSLSRNHINNDAEQLILLSDVSELRGLQDSLAQQKHLSAMGEMVAGLAHQIRTPLATAILYASQLAKPTLPATKQQQFSDKILERLHYLERQVNDMLIYAKQGRLAMQGFSWQGLLHHLAERMEQYSGAFLLDNRVVDDIVLGNEDALCGALLNLLNNAIEAGAGTISLVAEQDRRGIVVSLQDNGPGIAELALAQLFEAFYTTKTHGTGLGLAVADSVVKAHGGQITCQSVLGEGCRFTLFLPIVQNALSLSTQAVPERDYEAV